jgi:hypothetical protein
VEASEGVVVFEEGYEGCCEGVGGLGFHDVGFGVGFVFVDGWRGSWVVVDNGKELRHRRRGLSCETLHMWSVGALLLLHPVLCLFSDLS